MAPLNIYPKFSRTFQVRNSMLEVCWKPLTCKIPGTFCFHRIHPTLTLKFRNSFSVHRWDHSVHVFLQGFSHFASVLNSLL